MRQHARLLICGAAALLVASGCFRGRVGKKICTESPMALVRNTTDVILDIYYRTAATGGEIYLATAGPGVTRYEIPAGPSETVFLSFTRSVGNPRSRLALPISATRVQLETTCDPARPE